MSQQDLDEMAELLGIFHAETADHILTISQGILQLEKVPDDREVLEEIFRAAHSLKGAARLIGLKEIEEISHHMEDTLNATRKGEIRFNSETADLLYQGLDKIKAAVDRMSGGGEGGDTPMSSEVEQQLGNALTLGTTTAKSMAPTPEAPPAPEPPSLPPAPQPLPPPRPVSTAAVAAPSSPPAPVTPAPQPAPELARPTYVAPPPAAVGPPRGTGPAAAVVMDETIRVTTKKLDILMNQVSELITNRINTEHHLQDLIGTATDLDDWRREWSAFKHKNRIQQWMTGEAGQKLWNWLEHYHQQASEMSERLQQVSRKLDEEMQHQTITLKEVQDSVSQLRLLPLSTLFDQFHRLVRDLARQEKKEVNFVVEGAETQIDKRIIEEIKDPLVHLLRNCVDHGLEEPDQRRARGKDPQGQVFLRAHQLGSNIVIEVGDDGRGFDLNEIRDSAVRKGLVTTAEAYALSDQEAVNLIFLPGFSTTRIITDVSGRGVGMNVVKTNIERIKGTITVHPTKGRGVLFRMSLPLTIATTYILLFRSGPQLYAMPASNVRQVLVLDPSQIKQVESRRVISIEGQTIALGAFSELMGGVSQTLDQGRVPTILLGTGERQLALMVDEIQGDQEVVVRNFRYPLKRVRHLAGATTLSDGTLALVINPADLLRTAEREERGRGAGAAPAARGKTERIKPPRVLIVDDSITTRTLEKNILRSAGYDVAVAVDGQEALALLAESPYDIVVSDVEMPKVDGFQLTASIKGNEKYSDIPVILVTSLQSDVHRRRGLEVGADAYITKGSFDQNNLLDTIRRLI